MLKAFCISVMIKESHQDEDTGDEKMMKRMKTRKKTKAMWR